MSPATTDAIRLATYTAGDQQRALYALRTGNTFLLTDTPLDPDGREYIVERHIESIDALRGIVNDYLDQAATHDVPPADIAALYPLETEVVA